MLLQWHRGMGPSVKHVLGVLEWSYVVPEKPFLDALASLESDISLTKLLTYRQFLVVRYRINGFQTNLDTNNQSINKLGD